MMDLRWADDWFIVARTPEALQKILNVLHGELEELGLSLCPDKKHKASWMCNRWAKKEGQQIVVKGKVVHEIGNDGAMTILGSACTPMEGPSMAAAKHRVRCA